MNDSSSKLSGQGSDRTEEQRMLCETARRIVEDHAVPLIMEAERKERFPMEVIPPLREAGLLGGTIPQRYGGSGFDYLTHALVIEEVSRTWQVLGSLLGMASGPVGRGLLSYGSEEQRERWLRPLASGQVLAGYALTEPGSGSDAAAMSTRATRVEGGYLLHGSKTWIDWAGDGDFFLTFARTDPGTTGARGVSAFIVEQGAPGFTSTIMSGKLGMKALTVGELLFDDCFVPESHRIGAEGDGFTVAMGALEEARLAVAARLCGGIAGCLELAVNYANQRQLFGRALGDFQLTQTKLADMAVALDAGRALTHRAAELKDQGRASAGRAVLAAKLFTQEAYMRVAHDAVQIFGAYGMSDEYPVNRHFRDAKVSEVTGGTNEILRILLAEQVLGKRTGR